MAITDFPNGEAAAGNVVQGNYIGTDVTGTADLGNGEDGVFISGGVNNTIGGTSAGARNIISANGHLGRPNDGRSGIEIWNGASGNLIQGNFIGTDVAGNTPLGNREYGVFIQNSYGNTIGGSSQAANVIANSGAAGVWIQSGTNNPVRFNSIHSNGGLGIDLDNPGAASNDSGDVDAGANNLQNFPLITFARVDSGGSTTIRGSLNSAASTVFQVDCYANPVGDASGFGEGRFYVGSGTIATDSLGKGVFNVPSAGVVVPGQVITATATDPNGNTSEFSAGRPSVSTNIRIGSALVANGIAFSWPSAAATYRLQVTRTLESPVPWTDVATSPTDDGSRKTVVIPTGPVTTNFFYRLISP